jgi:hypothetical protein
MEKNTQWGSLKRRMVAFLRELYLRNAYTLIACKPVFNNKSELVIKPLPFDITMHF